MAKINFNRLEQLSPYTLARQIENSSLSMGARENAIRMLARIAAKSKDARDEMVEIVNKRRFCGEGTGNLIRHTIIDEVCRNPHPDYARDFLKSSLSGMECEKVEEALGAKLRDGFFEPDPLVEGKCCAFSESRAGERRFAPEERSRTLSDFIRHVFGVCKPEGVELRYGNLDWDPHAELFINHAGGFPLDRKTGETLICFFMARFGSGKDYRETAGMYDWISSDSMLPQPRSFLKKWDSRRDGRTKIHLRLAVSPDEFGEAEKCLNELMYGKMGEKRSMLMEIAELIHGKGWARKDNTFDLRWDHKQHKAVLFVGDFDGERGDITRILSSRFGREMVGRRSMFDRNYDWVSRGSTPENPGSYMKSWMKGGYGRGESIKMRLEMALAIAYEEFEKARDAFSLIKSQYVLIDDPKKRTPTSFISGLVEAGCVANPAEIGLETWQDRVGHTIVLTWERGRGSEPFHDTDRYFLSRFGQLDMVSAVKYRISMRDYIWAGEGVREQGMGHEPTCYMDRGTDIRGGRMRHTYKLKLSYLPRKEAEELEAYVKAVKIKFADAGKDGAE